MIKNSAILIEMCFFLCRVQCAAAEAKGPDPGYYTQHQCGEAA